MSAPSPSSPIDVVDDANRPVTTTQRRRVPEPGLNFRTVHIFVFNRDGELLLQRLAKSRNRNPLKWGSSVAGYLHAGESYREAAERRLREELGLRTSLQEVGVTSMEDEGSTKFVGLFTTTADDPEIREPDHIADIRYLPLDEIDSLVRVSPDALTGTFRHVYRYYSDAVRPGP